jgi:hypothetical protein
MFKRSNLDALHVLSSELQSNSDFAGLKRAERIEALKTDGRKTYWESESVGEAVALWQGPGRIARIEKIGSTYTIVVFKPTTRELRPANSLEDAYARVEAHLKEFNVIR